MIAAIDKAAGTFRLQSKHCCRLLNHYTACFEILFTLHLLRTVAEPEAVEPAILQFMNESFRDYASDSGYMRLRYPDVLEGDLVFTIYFTAPVVRFAIDGRRKEVYKKIITVYAGFYNNSPVYILHFVG